MEKVWNSCCGEGNWESAGAKYQTEKLGLEGVEGTAVFWEVTLQCSVSLHLLSAAWRQKQEAVRGVTWGWRWG
jgi:hypothetical protein